MTAGLHDGDLYIVAARPGMGKTSFVLNLAAQLARAAARRRSEGSADAVRAVRLRRGVLLARDAARAARLASARSDARVDVSQDPQRQHRQEDWSNLTEAASYLGRLPLWLDDTPASACSSCARRSGACRPRSSARAPTAPRRKRLGLVVIDYLQLMKGRHGVHSREQEISELSRGLKQLAKELSVAGHRAHPAQPRGRDPHRRRTSARSSAILRESGAIEQDADTIIFIYRDEYYFPRRTEPGHRRAHHRQAAQRPDRQGEAALQQGVHPLRQPRAGRIRVQRLGRFSGR